MILSKQQEFSDNQAIVATAVSQNYIDLGETGAPHRGNQLVRDIGKGSDVPLTVVVTEDFNNLTSLQVEVQVSSDEAFSSPKTAQVSIPVPIAELKAGDRIPIDHFQTGVDQRYLRLNYVVAGTAPTTGKISAGVSMGNQTNVN